jgi:hypothetical protein
MRRSKTWLVVPAVSALLVVGCAHCDLCDDFPKNCSNKYVQGSYTNWVGPGGQTATAPTQMNMLLAEPPGTVVSAPATPSTGPFSGTDTVSPPADSSKPAAPAEAKPGLPGEPPLSPPPSNPPAAGTGTTSIK